MRPITLCSVALLLVTPAAVARGADAAPGPAASRAEASCEALVFSEAAAALDAGNPTLREARARIGAAQAAVAQARAPLLPTVTAGGSYTRNNEAVRVSFEDAIGGMLPEGFPQPTELPDDLIIQPLEAFAATGAVRVPLLVAPAWAGLAAARRGVEATERAADTVSLELRTALARLGWAAAAADDAVAAAERAVEAARHHTASARRAVEAGTEAPLSVLRAETEAVRRESDLAGLRAERDRLRLAAGILVGRSAPLCVRMREATEPGDLDPVALTEVALSARPEPALERARIAAAEERVAAARWALAPQLFATGAAFASDVPYPTGERTGWRATVELAWPIFDGGARYGRRREAQASLEGARAALDARRLKVRQEVADAVRDVEVSLERLRLAEQRHTLAAAAAASANRLFEGGLAGSLDVLDAEDRLYLADLGLADARGRLGAALAGLHRAVGAVP